MEAEASRLLLERRRLARFGLQLGPRERMLLERLLYRLGWTMPKNYSRRVVVRNARRPFTTNDALVQHAAAAMDNPTDNVTLLAFADHLADSERDPELADAFHRWVSGQGVKELMPLIHPNHINGYLIRGPYQSENGRGAITAREGIYRDAPDVEMRQDRGRRWDDTANTYVEPPELPTFAKRHDETGWHVRVPDRSNRESLITRRKRGRLLSTLEVADALNKSSGPRALVHVIVGLRHFHPTGDRLTKGDRTVKFRRRAVVRYAKIDGHEPAHHLVAGFPIEYALRHLANDPKNPDDVRDLAWIALTGKNKLTGEANPDGIPSALWALNDALQEIDHPLAANKEGGYKWMSAADKILLDRHTHTALTELAADVRRSHNAHHWNRDWNYTPEGQAMRVAQALGKQKHHDRTVAQRNTLMLDRVRARVAELSPGVPPEHVDESIRRHAHRALHVWRIHHGLGAANPGERTVVNNEYAEDATRPLAKHDEEKEKKADDGVYQSIMNKKATRYAKRYRGLKKYTYWSIPAGWNSVGGRTQAATEVWEYRPKRSNGIWVWGGKKTPHSSTDAPHSVTRYPSLKDAEEALGQTVHHPGSGILGSPLTPQEVWAHTDGKEGEAPKPAEQDWRPSEAMPEDFYSASRKGARPRKYAEEAYNVLSVKGMTKVRHPRLGAIIRVSEYRPKKTGSGNWFWMAHRELSNHRDLASAFEKHGYVETDPQLKPLTPEEVWMHTSGAEGTPPKTPEQDWRPDSAMPEDFYSMSRVGVVVRYSHKSFQDAIGNDELDMTARGVYADWLEEHAPETATRTVLDRLRNHQGRLWVGMSPKGKVLAIPRLSKDILAKMAADNPWGVPDGTFYHSTSRNSKGKAHGVRASGKMQTWKRDPERFRVPWKFGLYDNGEFVPRNVYEWLVEDPTAEPVEYHDPNQMRRKYAKKQLTGTFIDALRRAKASNSNALKAAGEKIARQIGAWPTKTFSAVHDTPRGSTPGVAQVVYGRTTPEQVHALGAWVGLVGNLPGVAVFHSRPSGPDFLHRVRAEGSGLDLRERLSRAGITDRVLVPHSKGFDVLVPDRGGRLRRALQKYAEAHSVHLESSPGHFNTLGSTDQGQARDQFRKATMKRQGRPRKYMMGRTHADFLQKILADPHDRTAPLVYADWLEENGHTAVAEVLRRHVEQEAKNDPQAHKYVMTSFEPAPWTGYHVGDDGVANRLGQPHAFMPRFWHDKKRKIPSVGVNVLWPVLPGWYDQNRVFKGQPIHAGISVPYRHAHRLFSKMRDEGVHNADKAVEALESHFPELRGAKYSRRGRARKYMTGRQDLLNELQKPEYAAHMAGLDDPLQGLRGVAADHMDEQGREEEAKLLRTPGQHVVIHQGRVLPNYMERQVWGDGSHEQFVKPTHDRERSDDGPEYAGHHGFTYWFATYGMPQRIARSGGLENVGRKRVWWWNPADGEGLHPEDVARHHPEYERYQRTSEMGGEPVLMTPAEIAWMKHHAKTASFKRG